MHTERPLAVVILVLASLLWAGCQCGASPAAESDDGGDGSGGGSDGGELPEWDVDAAGLRPEAKLEPGEWFTPNGIDGGLLPSGNGLVVQPDSGYLVLDPSGGSNTGQAGEYLWLANPGGYGSVSKIETATGRELGRYVAVVPTDGRGQANGLRFDGTHSPSRTAVDAWGDVWVANRAPDEQGSVTKISGNPLGCVDRDGDGVIETSHDEDGDGLISSGEMITPSAANASDPLAYDECVLFSEAIGVGGHTEPSIPRAIAIDKDGSVWVGLWCGLPGTSDFNPGCTRDDRGHHGAFIKLDPDSGALLTLATGKQYAVTTLAPYGAAIDASGRVWYTSIGRTVAGAVSTAEGREVGFFEDTSTDCGSYGINVQVRPRVEASPITSVWIAAGYRKCEAWAARFRVDDSGSALGGSWRIFDLASQLGGEAFGMSRGIAVDETGTVWMSADHDAGVDVARLMAFDGESGTVKSLSALGGSKVIDFTGHFSTNPPREGIGVGMASGNGHKQVWLAANNGYALAADRDTGEVLQRSKDLGNLYTYSDFTGYNLRTFTSPQGNYKATLLGCESGRSVWGRLVWDAEVPAGGSLVFFARSVDRAGNASSDRIGPFSTSPADLSVLPQGALLQIEAQFQAAPVGGGSPILKSLFATYRCASQVN